MQNTITDLSNILFEQLERLNDEDLDDKGLKKEIDRSKAISSVSANLVGIFKVELDATKFAADNGCFRGQELEILPKQLISKN